MAADISGIRFIDQMLDVFFLSYNEPYADANYELLLAKAPHARRVNGVKGFVEAHQACASRSLTNNFYVVDADAHILDSFDFAFTPSKYRTWWGVPQSEMICIWNSINPINDLVYGHGGVKILPKQGLLQRTANAIDFTTGFGLPIKAFEEISNITAFNYDEFNTWRSAFREAVKLVMNLDDQTIKHKLNYDQDLIDRYYKESQDRLTVWCTQGLDRLYGSYAIDGANYGKSYALAHARDHDKLRQINDLEWTKNEFNKFYAG